MMGIRGFLQLMAGCMALGAGAVCAQSFPSRPIQFVVPYPPGGANDIFARYLGPLMTESMGQNVLVVNQAGAGGTIGTAAVARAKPDGHTLLLGSSGNLAVAPSLIAKMPYDTLKDLAPVTMLGNVPNILAVHPSIAVNSVKQLVAMAKADPGKLAFGSSGIGGSGHLAGELFNVMAEVKMTHVPYKGSGPSVTALVAGEISLTFENMITLMPHAKSGRIRAIAITTPQRSPVVPDLPTIAESGLPGYVAGPWFAIMTTGGTPAPVVSALNRELVKILGRPEVVKFLSDRGAELVTGTPAELAAFLRSEITRWAQVVREANIKTD